jgi:hypothetical protein
MGAPRNLPSEDFYETIRSSARVGVCACPNDGAACRAADNKSGLIARPAPPPAFGEESASPPPGFASSFASNSSSIKSVHKAQQSLLALLAGSFWPRRKCKKGSRWLPFLFCCCRLKKFAVKRSCSGDAHRKSGVISLCFAPSPVESCSPPELFELTMSLYSWRKFNASEEIAKFTALYQDFISLGMLFDK